MDKVRRLKERGQGWSEKHQRKLLLAAVEHNSLDVLRYLCERGCAWHIHASPMAVRKRHVEALKMLHANGCPFAWCWLEDLVEEKAQCAPKGDGRKRDRAAFEAEFASD